MFPDLREERTKRSPTQIRSQSSTSQAWTVGAAAMVRTTCASSGLSWDTRAKYFEWCAGPGFIGFSLLAYGLCDAVVLADINPDAVRCSLETVKRNRLEARVRVFQSDNLDGIPANEK